MACESEEEVSRCQLSGCDVVLLSTPLGLRLQWLSHTDGEVLGTAVVTRQECSGKLYPVLLDLNLERAVFGREITVDPMFVISQGTATCALVVCKPGLVAAVHWKTPELCANICHTVLPVVWSGVMKVSNSTNAVIVVDAGGSISLGTAASTQIQTSIRKGLHWQTKFLPGSAVAFCGRKSSCVFSDGENSWFGKLSLTPQNFIDIECHKLKYCGVIRIECEGEDRVTLLTCDCRKYTCRWTELGTKDEVKSVDREAGNSFDDVRKAIQRCSELLGAEGKEIATLDLYMKQLSLAQRLVHDDVSIFSSSIKVEQSLEIRGSYIAIIHLQKHRSDINVDGRWWRLMVITEESEECKYLNIKLDEESLESDLCITVPIPPPHTQNFPHCITLKIFLIFEHLVTGVPICQIFACPIIIDAVDFFTHERILCPKSLTAQSFTLDLDKIQKSTKTFSKMERKSKTLPPCEVSMSFDACDKNLVLLKSVLNAGNPNKDSDINFTDYKSTLFHPEGKIVVKCRLNKGCVFVTLEGSDANLVLSVRWAMERRVLHLGSIKETTLSPTLLRKAYHTQKVVNYEANEESGLATIAHVHNMTSNLLSLLPLS